MSGRDSALAAHVRATPQALLVEWRDGTVSEFAALWLLDNLPEHRDPHSGQRLIDVADLPPRPCIRSAVADGAAIRIEWDGEPGTSLVRTDWLAGLVRESRRRTQFARRLWRDAPAPAHFAWEGFVEWRRAADLRSAWLKRLLIDGIAFLRQLPASDAAILEAMQLAGQVLETNYGLVFDVRSVPQPENLAYSDLGLGLHTDNPYRDPVPGFQALHALVSSPHGGESLFADGIAIAEALRAEDADAFEVLTRTPVPFHYRSQEAELRAERPLIELSCSGEVAAVHYNSRSIAPLALPARETERFYGAYRRFALLLREARRQLKYRLADGELVVFDNQRLLHGRTGFSSARHARHLRGCYLTRDSLYSTAARLLRAADRESSDERR